MSNCANCGSSCHGALCSECELIDANEARHGTDTTTGHGSPGDAASRAADDSREWTLKQQGLDGSPEGQTTLSGDVVKPRGDD